MPKLNIVKIHSLIFLIYIVGALGIIIPFTHQLFVFLTPLALLFSASLLILDIFQSKKASFSKNNFIFGFVVYISAFTIELIGVNSGWPFGSYIYKEALGIKIAGTPLLIGINWWLLVYCSAAFVYKINNVFLRIISASLIMTALDIIMEQVACKTQMWCWQNDLIPLRNYVSWFIIAIFFHTIKAAFILTEESKLARKLFLAQVLYFCILLLAFKLIPSIVL